MTRIDHAESNEREQRDGRWLRKRFEILLRDNCTCVECGREDEACDVHHCYYTAGKYIWEYPNEALKTLCRRCHAAKHDMGGLAAVVFIDARMLLSESWAQRKAQIRKVRTFRQMAELR